MNLNYNPWKIKFSSSSSLPPALSLSRSVEFVAGFKSFSSVFELELRRLGYNADYAIPFSTSPLLSAGPLPPNHSVETQPERERQADRQTETKRERERER